MLNNLFVVPIPYNSRKNYLHCTNTIDCNGRHYKVTIKPIWLVFRRLVQELCNFSWKKIGKIKNLSVRIGQNYRSTVEKTLFLQTKKFNYFR